MMKSVVSLMIFVCFLTLNAEDAVMGNAGSEFEFVPRASVVIEAQKDLFSNGQDDNLDNWFGRLDLGGDLTKGASSVSALLRLYPAGFGHDFRGPSLKTVDQYEYYQGFKVVSGPGGFPIYIPYEDTVLVGEDTVVDLENIQEYSMERVQLYRALYTYEGANMNLRVGRDFVSRTNGVFFGNYIDGGLFSTSFDDRGSFANFLEVEKDMGMTAFSIMLQATDPQLNKGNLRTFFRVNPLEDLSTSLEYKSNVFDIVYDDDVSVIHNFALNTEYVFPQEAKVFAEMGVNNIHSDLDAYVPVLVGVQYPVNEVLKFVQAELEMLKTGDRERLTAVTENPVLYGVYTAFELNDYSSLDVGLFSRTDAAKPTVAVDFTGGF
ncbi:MAG: hypothetical protein ACQEQ4_08795 [Fibrobacterota bacterium]